MHAQLPWVITRNGGLADWALGYNFAMLTAYMLLNFISWSKNGRL